MSIKSILSFAAGMLLSSTLVTAQTQTGQAATTQPIQSNANYTGVNPTSEMSQVTTSTLPDPLRSTLQSNQQYKGWEGGQWYFNSTTNQYSVQMPVSNTGSVNPLTTSGTQTTLVNPTSPTQSSATPAANPLGSPLSPTTAPALQTNPSSTPTSQPLPSVTIPTWYRFDANGKLIPQPKEN